MKKLLLLTIMTLSTIMSYGQQIVITVQPKEISESELEKLKIKDNTKAFYNYELIAEPKSNEDIKKIINERYPIKKLGVINPPQNLKCLKKLTGKIDDTKLSKRNKECQKEYQALKEKKRSINLSLDKSSIDEINKQKAKDIQLIVKFGKQKIEKIDQIAYLIDKKKPLTLSLSSNKFEFQDKKNKNKKKAKIVLNGKTPSLRLKIKMKDEYRPRVTFINKSGEMLKYSCGRQSKCVEYSKVFKDTLWIGKKVSSPNSKKKQAKKSNHQQRYYLKNIPNTTAKNDFFSITKEQTTDKRTNRTDYKIIIKKNEIKVTFSHKQSNIINAPQKIRFNKKSYDINQSSLIKDFTTYQMYQEISKNRFSKSNYYKEGKIKRKYDKKTITLTLTDKHIKKVKITCQLEELKISRGEFKEKIQRQDADGGSTTLKIGEQSITCGTTYPIYTKGLDKLLKEKVAQNDPDYPKPTCQYDKKKNEIACQSKNYKLLLVYLPYSSSDQFMRKVSKDKYAYAETLEAIEKYFYKHYKENKAITAKYNEPYFKLYSNEMAQKLKGKRLNPPIPENFASGRTSTYQFKKNTVTGHTRKLFTQSGEVALIYFASIENNEIYDDFCASGFNNRLLIINFEEDGFSEKECQSEYKSRKEKKKNFKIKVISFTKKGFTPRDMENFLNDNKEVMSKFLLK